MLSGGDFRPPASLEGEEEIIFGSCFLRSKIIFAYLTKN